MHLVPGFAVPVVDTTGAGDVLSAALIAAWLLENRPAAEAAGSPPRLPRFPARAGASGRRCPRGPRRQALAGVR